MADTAVATSETPVAAATPSKKPSKASAGGAASAAAKRPKAKPTHPKTAEMGRDREQSQQAIKKYIASQYKVDADKLTAFIRKYLKSAVESGALIQTKSKGASGSFKLESKSAAAKKPATASASSASGKGAASGSAASKSKKKSTAAAPSASVAAGRDES